MNKSILSLILLATPMAFGGNSSSGKPVNTTSSTQAHQFNSNSNDRFDNVDTRTNSKSTPASVGMENRELQADITQEENQWATEETQVATSGTSTGEQSPTSASTSPTQSEDVVYETEQEQPRMSGSSTTPSASSETGKTTTSSSKSSPAAGAAIGTSAVGTKNKPSSTTETRETSTTTTSSSNENESSDSSLSGSSAAAGGMAAGTAANKNATGATGNDLTAQDTATTEQASETVRKIRASITDDKNLSMSAHNVKIISENNSIYLKGPVKSAAEKAKVEELAKRMAGNTAVINQTYVEKR